MFVNRWFGLGLGLLACSVQAQLTQNITLGNPKALALGHAVTADPPGLDSIHFNPAGLAKIKGRQQQFKLLMASMEITSETGSQQNSPAVIDAFNQINEGQTFPVDDQANLKASTSEPLLMLPFQGLTEVPFIIAPFGGMAAQVPGEPWTVATTVYTPQSIGFIRDREKDPGSYQGYQMAISRITYFSPSIGIQLTDTLAAGLSIGLSWHGFGTVTKFRAPEQTLIFVGGAATQLQNAGIDLALLGAFDNVGDLTLEMEDALSPSFNVGLLWEPTSWLAFGFVYQSEAKAQMEGDFKMEYTEEFLGTTVDLLPISPALGLLGGATFNAGEVEKGHVEMEMIVPQHISVGTSIKVLPDLKMNFDVKWTEFSKWDTLTISFDQNVDFLNLGSVINQVSAGFGVGDNADPNELRLPRHYQDVFSWALGFEYDWDDRMVLRFGYEPRGSAVPDDRVDFLVPLADATLFSVGMGYQLSKYTRFDIGLAYLHSEFDADVVQVLDENGEVVDVVGESLNANDTTPGQVVYNPYAYLPIRGETSAYLFSLSYDEKF